MEIQKGKQVGLPEEDANEIWDITFGIVNNEKVPLSAEEDFYFYFVLLTFFGLMFAKILGKYVNLLNFSFVCQYIQYVPF